jgi:hypothetical protein
LHRQFIGFILCEEISIVFAIIMCGVYIFECFRKQQILLSPNLPYLWNNEWLLCMNVYIFRSCRQAWREKRVWPRKVISSFIAGALYMFIFDLLARLRVDQVCQLFRRFLFSFTTDSIGD